MSFFGDVSVPRATRSSARSLPSPYFFNSLLEESEGLSSETARVLHCYQEKADSPDRLRAGRIQREEVKMIGNVKGARRVVGSFVCILGATILQGCDTTDILSSGDGPAPPPRNFSASYYARAIHLSWELGFGWNGEPFRIWGKRVSDPDYFFIAEVTSCADSLCSSADANVAPDVISIYYVTAVDPSGVEAASDEAIEVQVPQPIAPPIPGNPDVVPLDGALFITRNDSSL